MGKTGGGQQGGENTTPTGEANESSEEQNEQDELTDTGLTADELKGLGDRGRDALKAERDARRVAERAATQTKDELAKARRDFKAIETRLRTLENQGKPELERLQAERDQARADAEAAVTRARERAGRAAVIDAAVKAGATSPEFVYHAIAGR